MNSELKAFSGCIDGNSATLKMTDGAANPAITTPGTVLSNTLFINTPPDALHFDAAGTVKLTFVDGSISTRKVLAGTTYNWKVKQIWATGTVTITSQDIGLMYSNKRLRTKW